jgi:predicted ArsR family transcriptional regulator
MDPADDLQTRVSRIAALDQPARRTLYRLLTDRDTWLTRDQASEAADLPRPIAAFHLDKLAEAGLVDVSYERTTGRSGPGAGRPSKLYRRRRDEVAVSVPDRHYDLAGSLLAAAIADAAHTGAPIGDSLSTTALAAGRRIGSQSPTPVEAPSAGHDQQEALLRTLTRLGYEPHLLPHGEIALANCPFHRLAEEHRNLVCGMNLDFLTGILQGTDPSGGLRARLAPEPGNCCVRISPP